MEEVRVRDASEVLACECGQEFPIGRLGPELRAQIETAWNDHHKGPECAPTDEKGAAVARRHHEALLEETMREHGLVGQHARDSSRVGLKG